MIEVIGIPLLMKAVDFLFDEGHKIIRERRERRQSVQKKGENKLLVTKPVEKTESDIETLASTDSVQSREDMLHQKISEAAWSAREKEIEHLLSLAEIHSRNYRLATEQYARWGEALVPPIIVNNLEEAENSVADTMRKLQAALNKVSGKTVVIPELEEE